MVEVSYLDFANIILDGAAAFVLLGIMVYTSLYRKRGRLEDRLFFILILTGLTATVSEGIVLSLELCGALIPETMFMSFVTVMYLAYGLFAVNWCVYLMIKIGKVRMKTPLLRIFGVCLLVLLSVCGFIGAWYSFKSSVPFVESASYMILVYLPFLIACAVSFFVVRRHSFQAVIMLFTLLAAGLFFAFLLDCMSFMPIILSIVLIYAHLFRMTEDFYGEEVKK